MESKIYSEITHTEGPSDSAYSSEHENTPEHQTITSDYSIGKGVAISVLDGDLWKSFYRVGNEMIVTRPGRRFFPALIVSIRGINSELEYNISLRIVPADSHRYKFANTKWFAVGESEVDQDEARQVYYHPNSPSSGASWMKKPISFKSVKITHYPSSKNGNILLHTMHKYAIKIIVSPVDGSGDIVTALKETTFVAVSSYQNTNLTKLKIDNNPFAKGIRGRLKATDLHPYMQNISSRVLSLPFYNGEGCTLQSQGLDVSPHSISHAIPTSLVTASPSENIFPEVPVLPSFAQSFLPFPPFS